MIYTHSGEILRECPKLCVFSPHIYQLEGGEKEMKKKVLMSSITLLALMSIMVISSVEAKTVEPYWSCVEIWLVDEGKKWISEEGILHYKDSYWRGYESGTLGNATFEEWYNHLSLNLETGEGTLNAKWLLTLPEGTIAGSWRGKITLGYILSGTFVGTHGTGDFRGVKKMGSVYGVLLDPTHATANITGMVVYP